MHHKQRPEEVRRMSLGPGIAIVRREAPAALEHFVAEAVGALGYFRANAAGELAAIYRELWPKGTSATMLPHETVKHLLAEKGHSEPGGTRVTTLRITANLRRWEALQDEPIWSAWCDKVEFHCATAHACRAALALEGETVDRISRLPLPLVSCDREWCGCEWWQV